MDFELRRMDLWENVIPGFKYSKETPFFEMLVPTVDTVRYGFLLEKLLAVKQSVLYTGNTGVGKVRRLHYATTNADVCRIKYSTVETSCARGHTICPRPVQVVTLGGGK